ncbi:MAG: hypothetical protein ACTS3F_09835 [Phycisphaerales bacterium]
MVGLLTILIALICLGLVALIFIDDARGKVPIVSLRSVFILGFIIFQLTSAIYAVVTGNWNQYTPPDVEPVLTHFVLAATFFLIVFLISYAKPPLANAIVSRLPASDRTPGVPKLMLLAVCVSFTGLLLRQVPIPYVGILTGEAGNACAAVAAGIAGWIWAPRLFNPSVAGFAFVIIAVNVLSAMWGKFGRDELVSTFASIVWSMYFSYFWSLPKSRYFPSMFAVAAAGFVFIALFSSVRDATEKDRTAFQHLQLMLTGGSVTEGSFKLLQGQDGAAVSMWLLGQFPESREYTPMLSLWYTFAIPVPREIWPGKPEPISTKIASWANLRGVNQAGITIAPGIIGQTWSDGGWVAIPIYGAFFGILLGFLDRWTWRNWSNIFVVVSTGAALGQLLGVPRGDVSNFTYRFMYLVGAAYAIMFVFAKILRFERGEPQTYALLEAELDPDSQEWEGRFFAHYDAEADEEHFDPYADTYGVPADQLYYGDAPDYPDPDQHQP